MRRLIPWCAIVLSVIGCSATGPSTVQQVSLDPEGEPAGRADVTLIGSRVPGEETTTASDDTEIISVAEVPGVPVTDAAPPALKKVCRRVQRTGSHRYRKVCYTEAEIEASTSKAREVFGELHRQQQLPGGN